MVIGVLILSTFLMFSGFGSDNYAKNSVIDAHNKKQLTAMQQATIDKYKMVNQSLIPTGVYQASETDVTLAHDIKHTRTLYVNSDTKTATITEKATLRHDFVMFNDLEFTTKADINQVGSVLGFSNVKGDFGKITPIIIESVNPNGFVAIDFCSEATTSNPCNNGLTKFNYQKAQ